MRPYSNIILKLSKHIHDWLMSGVLGFCNFCLPAVVQASTEQLLYAANAAHRRTCSSDDVEEAEGEEVQEIQQD